MPVRADPQDGRVIIPVVINMIRLPDLLIGENKTSNRLKLL
jgi:hypothetical protein